MTLPDLTPATVEHHCRGCACYAVHLYGVEYGTGRSVAFRVLKRTAHRIFYVRREIIGTVDRQQLDDVGWVRRAAAYDAADLVVYTDPPTPERKLSPLRAAMADAHPDRGGTAEAFIRARDAYVAARRAGGAA